MYSIYTHIFALTINMIQFLCCSIDRKIFRPQLYQQFIPKVYPQSFISRNKYFEAYFVAWGFPHSGALWEKVSDLLLLFRNQSDQLYGFTYFLYVIHLNFSTDELECFFFFSSADELMRAKRTEETYAWSRPLQVDEAWAADFRIYGVRRLMHNMFLPGLLLIIGGTRGYFVCLHKLRVLKSVRVEGKMMVTKWICLGASILCWDISRIGCDTISWYLCIASTCFFGIYLLLPEPDMYKFYWPKDHWESCFWQRVCKKFRATNAPYTI